MPIPIVYSDRYELDLGAHVWPITKYRLIANRLVDENLIQPGSLLEPSACSWEDLALVHTLEYLTKIRTGTLSADDVLTMELPWSADLGERFRLMVGGTCLAAERALGTGAAVHLGGGLHHAYPNHGEGFCPFNDVAVAVRRLQSSGRITRAAIVDCDVHHGNGTAFIFERDPSVFTFSIHQQHNYPAFKPRSDLDIGLDDGATDHEYLDRLRGAMNAVLESGPEIVFYLAGADPYEGDRLGGLGLTIEGLRLRDRLVIDAARSVAIPMVVTLAGGYAARVEDTVQIHYNTVLETLNGPPGG